MAEFVYYSRRVGNNDLVDKKSLNYLLGHSCFRERRSGEKKRKSVRGCIVGPDMSVLSLVITKKGEGELPGITDKYIPRRLGPHRASKIRKLFVSLCVVIYFFCTY